MASVQSSPRASATSREGSLAEPRLWASGAVSLDEAEAFAAQVTSVASDQATIARNLVAMSPAIQVRGVFFEGLSRIVRQAKGDAALAQLRLRAGTPAHVIAFRHYAHRDFYKLYYLVARLLYPSETLPRSLRLTARTFFPIFRDSLLGKTMNALMGDKPATILPLLAKAYNLSVAGNEHTSQQVSPQEIAWSCRVEPVEWYDQTFAGIVEGTVPEGETIALQVRTVSRALRGGAVDYRFQLTW
jgi:uncharacterized protein (TIGR02265 family)